MPKITKETRINREREKLQYAFRDSSGSVKRIAFGLIDRVAFMSVTLEDLEAEIKRSGTVERYQHGKEQSGMKASAALQAYNATMKNYNSVIKQLSDLLPGEEKLPASRKSLADLLRDAKAKAE